jgi:hypothetical protein
MTMMMKNSVTKPPAATGTVAGASLRELFEGEMISATTRKEKQKNNSTTERHARRLAAGP